jgi:hypothetical protein
VQLTTVLDIVFAVGVVVAAVALAGAALRLLPRPALMSLTVLAAGAAVTGWVFYALRHDRELAVSAAGLTGCALAAGASLLLQRALARVADVDRRLGEAQGRLEARIAQETADRAVELERTLARARADSVSLLMEEERRIAEARRTEFTEREHAIGDTLTRAVTKTQAQVEQRLAGWAQDLDRAAETTRARIQELAAQQKSLLSDVELRLAADADRLAAESEEQRASLTRFRGELEKALEEALNAAHAEVENHAVERRRALHELDERLRRRERELMERVEREEVEAVHRISAGFEDVAGRQIEQMARIVERATATYSDEATQQFATLVKAGREDAARRLSRELDRSVEVFAREAEAVLAERLAHVGDAGAQRLERRLEEAAHALERQRDEWMTAMDSRIVALEADVRRRLEELSADAEAERAVLEARVQDLVRRVESAGALHGRS